jgi:gamma-glutamyltranspeptidase/glutathione hydrolase
MSGVAVATSSQLAADVGAEICRAGGNAVDAAIATCLTSTTTEPGICSLGASGFVTIWPAGGDHVTIDGYAAMPGLGLPPEELGLNAWPVDLKYGGGVRTIVGWGSIAVPGCIAALGMASERYGKLPWREVVMPAARIATKGFPLPSHCHHYLKFAIDSIYGWDPNNDGILTDPTGSLIPPYTIVRIPGLGDALERIAEKGPDEFYCGDLGKRIADYVSDNGGALNRRDMESYRAIEGTSLDVPLDAWHVATSPSPALGGATLGAMLLSIKDIGADGWTSEAVARLVDAQLAVTDFRHRRLDHSTSMAGDIRQLMESVREGTPLTSQDTVHTSVVDDSGCGCAITLSAGYGSGAIPPGTGCWLNNSLGELELSPGGLKIVAPGTRLTSNMAPTVARKPDGTVLAAGSPGADRITTAMLQALINFVHFGMSLEDAVAHPRVHVETTPEGYRVACEPGMPMDKVTLPTRHFDNISMFFGGVSAAEWSPVRGFEVASDPRRKGGTAIVEGA